MALESTWSVSESTLGRHRVLDVAVTRAATSGTGTTDTIARIALYGATLLSWRAARGEESIDLIDGYQTEAELTNQAGARSALMVPFSNRIADGSYDLDGHEHAMAPSPADGSVMHGLLRDREYELTRTDIGSDSVTVVLGNRDLRPGAFDGYPFSVDVDVTFTISERAVDLTISGTNVGPQPALFASGWHPYFTIGSTPIESLELEVPARGRVVTDDDLIPLPADAGFAPLLGDGDAKDYTTRRPIGRAEINDCYIELIPGGDGVIRSILADDAGGELELWQERGLMHAYTADGLSRAPRGSVALEPVEVMTDAYNRADQADALHLASGATRSFRFGAGFRQR